MRRTRVVLTLLIAMGVCPSVAAAQAENQPPTVTASRTPTGVRVGVPIAFTATAAIPTATR